MPEISSRADPGAAAQVSPIPALASMPAVRAIGILCFVLAAGCAGVKEAPPNVLAQRGPLMVDPSLLGRNQEPAVADQSRPAVAIQETAAPTLRLAEAIQEPVAPAPREPVIRVSEVVANEPLVGAPAPPSRNQNATKAAPPPAKTPAKVIASPAASEQPRKNADPPPVAGKPEQPLDIAALKERLRDTNAIGMFTKLALKNQVDDLLQQFRAHYLSGQKTNVAALRQAYDMLVLKVLALIQDSDPSLARSISGSREAIWGILADPEKFNSVS